MKPQAEQGVVVVEPILVGDMRPLFPLVQAWQPGLTWARWQSFARRSARAKGQGKEGILVARRSGHTLPCGVVCYRVDHDLRAGLMLTAEHFIALDLLYPEAVRAALAAALDGLAAGFGCQVIRSILHDGEAEVAQDLRLAGHQSDGMTLTKHRFDPQR